MASDNTLQMSPAREHRAQSPKEQAKMEQREGRAVREGYLSMWCGISGGAWVGGHGWGVWVGGAVVGV